MHVGIANPQWRGKRYRYSRRMRNRNFTYLVRGPWTCMPSCFRSFPGSRGRTCAVHVRDETHHRIPWSLWLPSKHALVTDSALAIRNGQSISNTLSETSRTDTRIVRQTNRTLRWRHNDHDGVSNHQPHDCQSKHQSSASLAFVWGIHRWLPHTNGQ